MLNANVTREELVKVQAQLKDSNKTMAEMPNQMASCKALLKEVTEKLHEYELISKVHDKLKVRWRLGA